MYHIYSQETAHRVEHLMTRSTITLLPCTPFRNQNRGQKWLTVLYELHRMRTLASSIV